MYRLISIFLFSMTLCFSGLGQTRKVLNIPSELEVHKAEYSVDVSGFYNVEKALPSGYVTDGSVDYTDVIQKVLNDHKKVVFPSFPILINYKGLTVHSNTQLYFLDKAELRLKPNNKKSYEVLRLHNVENVNIYNPVIKGDRLKHAGNQGEHGMGISIRASKNIKIFNPFIENCWGDGIYLGHLRYKQVRDVKIYNGYLNHNRRNGISITSGENVLVENTVIGNTFGTLPESGVKIEPSNDKAIIDNITLENVQTFNNKDGIGFGGIEMFIGKKTKPININIVNHIDVASGNGLFIGRILSSKKLPGQPLKGQFTIVNPKWIKSLNSNFEKKKQYGRGPKIIFSKLPSSLRRDLWSNFKFDEDVYFLNNKGNLETLSKKK